MIFCGCFTSTECDWDAKQQREERDYAGARDEAHDHVPISAEVA
jgi:hypothetical protein